jgi:hypothetical protein
VSTCLQQSGGQGWTVAVEISDMTAGLHYMLLVYPLGAFNAHAPTSWFIYRREWLNACKENKVIYLGPVVSIQHATQIKLTWTRWEAD